MSEGSSPFFCTSKMARSSPEASGAAAGFLLLAMLYAAGCRERATLHETTRNTLTVFSRDYAFRLGGDEFALLLLGPMSPETCARKINLICEMVSAPYEIEGHTLTVGVSCGYALYPTESIDVRQVQCLADQRMYENKQLNHAREHGAEK